MTEPGSGQTIATLSDSPQTADAGDTGAAPLYPAETPLRMWLAAVIIVFAGAAAFSASLGVPFHFEDRLQISENVSVHRIATVQETFGQGGAGPVVWLLYAVNWAVTPDSAAAFHAVNIALHIVNALLIFFICRIFIRPGKQDALPWLPMAAGLLFVLHPLTTESVNYVVGRSVILATTFSLGAVLAVLSLETGSELRRRACLVGALICVALALGSHRIAWTLPLFLLAADWCRNGSGVTKRLGIHGLMIAATVAVVVATVFGGTDSPPRDAASPLWMEAELPPQVAIARAADLTINRRPLSAVQSAELDSIVVEFAGSAVENFEPTNVIPGIALIVVAFIGGMAALWFRHLLGFGLAWYAVALVFGAVWARNGMPFSERAVYFPVAGLAITAAGALTFVGGRQRVRMAAAACVLILLSVCSIASFTRSRIWLDEQTLWELARDTSARSPVAYHRLAVMYAERGDRALVKATSYITVGESIGAAGEQDRARNAYTKAAEYAGAAVEHGAVDGPTHVLFGRALHMAGASVEAEATLQEVLRTDPNNRDAMVELAAIYETRASVSGVRGDWARAADLYERAMSLAPPAHNEVARYGHVLMRLGDLVNAQAAYARAVQMEPAGPVAPALEDLTTNLQRIGTIESQAAQLGIANPNDPNASMAFAMAAVERSNFMQVLYTLADVLDSNPNFVPAWVMLGFAQARMGQVDAFLERYGTAPMPFPDAEALLSRFDTRPESADARAASSGNEDPPPSANTLPPWVDLAVQCVRFGMWDEAATYLLHAGTNSGDPRLPLIIVADLARELGDTQRYGQFLMRATEAHPDEPVPWLMIFDSSIGMGNGPAAAQALKEAETRGASADELSVRQSQLDELRKGGIDIIETVS